MRKVFDEANTDHIALEKFIEDLQKKAGSQKFTKSEIDAAVEKLGDDNAAMLADGDLMLI